MISPTCQQPERVERHGVPASVPVAMVGEAAAWFTAERAEGELIVRPTRPLPRRCLIRPVALFDRTRGFPDANTVMGKLLFAPGTTEPQRYRPFTRDRSRGFRELFLLVEACPDDGLFSSVTRWRNHEAVAKHLLAAAAVPWNGLPQRDIDELVGLEPWPEPLEGCVLHALTQWTEKLGRCVVEIGSLRGQSLAMLARALRGVDSDAMLLSVDPHLDRPDHHAYVRLALSQMGEEKRLVQFPCRSDEVWRLLRPATASLVFIDGDHAYHQVIADFNNYRDLLVPGGCLVFHDYGYGDHNGRPDVVPDVRPAIDKHVMDDQGFRPLLLAHTLMAFVKRRE